MSASMTEHRRMMNHGIAHVHKEVADDHYHDLRRPRKVRFFVNGDRFFKGKKLYITLHRYYNFNDLLNDLTGKLPTSLNLPYGVRQIFTPVGGRRVLDIEDLQDGETYVCAGFEGFKAIKYGRTELEPWSVGKTVKLSHLQDGDGTSEASYGSYKYRGFATNAFHPGRYYRANAANNNQGEPIATSRKWPATFGNTTQQQQRNPARLLGGSTEAVPLKPRIITIVRNGPRPRINVKILLNRRSIQSFEQLTADISEAFGPKWRNNRVQKLYTVHGREVRGVGDFFREDDCFIALGNERLNNRDVADIMSELYPDSAYAKTLVKEWDKQRRREKKAANRDTEVDKKDSGFAEGSENGVGIGGSSNREQEPEAQSTHRSSQRQNQNQRAGGKRVGSDREQESLTGSEAGSPQGYYMLSKLERDRRQAAKSERDKNRRRQSKLAEREKQAIDSDRKQRGLPRLNPLKPLDDIPRSKDHAPKDREDRAPQKMKDEKEREGGEAVAKTEEEKEAKKAKQEKEEREQAEKAARSRMAASEKAEKERQDKERQGKETESSDRIEQPNQKDKPTEKEPKAESEKDDTSRQDKPAEKGDNSPATATPHQQQQEQETDDKPEKKRKKEKDGNNTDKATSRSNKAKAKVIRRSKAERQISSDSFVTERYELGRALGDGNFAIVKISRQKATDQEFAMKVIDKPKLKGKEHMVENEIEIMKDCSHPNIVKLYEEYETRDKIYLVMELVKGGDLFDAITQSVKFGETDSASMVKDMSNALYYLHSRSIVHRDLKPENLLVHRNKDSSITVKLADFGLAMEVTCDMLHSVHRNKDSSITVKLADFGLAMEVKESIFTVCGTPTYVAPEILTEIGYGLEVDMWAVGVITYILLCGFPPFRSPDRNQTELFEFIKAGEYEFLSPYWDNVSDSAKDLIRRLLIVKKSKRYTAIDVLSHPWVVAGGNTSQPLPGVASLGAYCKEIKHELEEQAKLNQENYQKLKERRMKGEE